MDYFDELNTDDARTYFKIRSEVFDIKAFRSYMYDDDICRLCNNGPEDMDHIINQCEEIPRHMYENVDLRTEDVELVRVIVRRAQYFQESVANG